jgi:hypothetical protein
MNATRLVLLSQNWHPRKMFAASDLGTIQNPSNFPAMYQESTAITPTVAAGVVGFFTDERYLLERGADVAVNGGFVADTDWTKGTGWSITGGKAVRVGAGSSGALSQAYASIGVKAWEYTVVVEAVSATLTVRLTGGTAVIGPTISSAGTYRGILVGNGGNTAFALNCAANADTATIDSISFCEVLGSHGVQTGGTARPTLVAPGKIDYDGVNDALVTTWASSLGSSCTVGRSVPQGEATILTGQTITTTYTDNTDHCGLVIINRDLTATETNKLRRWLNRRAG